MPLMAVTKQQMDMANEVELMFVRRLEHHGLSLVDGLGLLDWMRDASHATPNEVEQAMIDEIEPYIEQRRAHHELSDVAVLGVLAWITQTMAANVIATVIRQRAQQSAGIIVPGPPPGHLRLGNNNDGR